MGSSRRNLEGRFAGDEGQRAEAVARYKRVADMNIKSTWQHSQYGLDYEVTAYAKARIIKPFVRIENFEKF